MKQYLIILSFIFYSYILFAPKSNNHDHNDNKPFNRRMHKKGPRINAMAYHRLFNNNVNKVKSKKQPKTPVSSPVKRDSESNKDLCKNFSKLTVNNN